MMSKLNSEIVIIGAGIVGISAAYYLTTKYSKANIILVDAGTPMSLTSAQSGENYRNWWPHPTMAAFCNHSIDLMEDLARNTNNVFNMSRRGYALATRNDRIDEILKLLYVEDAAHADEVRIHEPSGRTLHPTSHYQKIVDDDWQQSPSGIDVLCDKALIREAFPAMDPSINSVIHIRRAGEISAQQLGQYMLTKIKARGGRVIPAHVCNVTHNGSFQLETVPSGKSGGSTTDVEHIEADVLINAAGPMVNHIANMLDSELPITNIAQQKIAFKDKQNVIPRTTPFSIDLDPKYLDWTEQDKQFLQDEPELDWLTQLMLGGTHCRPDGGINGEWIKLGWAYNDRPFTETKTDSNNDGQRQSPLWSMHLDDHFPEIVLRGAAALFPGLKTYYGKLPREFIHYGGFYTMTPENWPLIGPMGVSGSFCIAALSGFGTMAACAAGELCADWIYGESKPHYAQHLSLGRYKNNALMEKLNSLESNGVL